MDKGISLVLPSEGNEMEVNKINIVNILVNESGKVLLDDKPTRLKDIKSIAERRISQNNKVIFSVQTHPRTKYQVYIKVLDQLKSAKAQKISIANPPSF
jgi:biopolymer transport protein ExbD